MDAGPTADGSDALVIDSMSIPSNGCWNLAARVLKVPLSACLEDIGEHLEITSNLSIDTSTGISTDSSGASPITCALISNGPDLICALSAKKITIRAGVTLSARGELPLALLAHDIDVQGTIDVASHLGQPPGPGAVQSGCNLRRGASEAGGGGGGGFNNAGGDGGDQGGVLKSGAEGGASITAASLRGGCSGTGGGDDGDPPGLGGGGGGAVWLSVDTGNLTLGSAATINASGAGGAAGTSPNRGGSGGGSGGLIVLQAPMIVWDPSSVIFANGGGGGGGAKGETLGQPGGDPLRENVEGNDAGGHGGAGPGDMPPSRAGDGGNGDPSVSRDGEDGEDSDSGGGGGGGSIGLIWVSSPTSLAGTKIDPDPIGLDP